MKLEHQNDKLLIGAIALLATLVSVDVACTPKTAVDVASLTSCIEGQLEAGNTNVLNIAAACGSQDIALVTDVIGALEKAQKAKPFAISKPQSEGGLDSH
jgi:hypothetical protein